MLPKPSLFLMRGGDSEFINYLIYTIPRNCVQNVSISLEKNKMNLNKIEILDGQLQFFPAPVTVDPQLIRDSHLIAAALVKKPPGAARTVLFLQAAAKFLQIPKKQKFLAPAVRLHRKTGKILLGADASPSDQVHSLLGKEGLGIPCAIGFQLFQFLGQFHAGITNRHGHINMYQGRKVLSGQAAV